ncbi:hypothetical protein HanXRQr2_Chr01g0035091 [Helianthus annuus]|uniref:Uncharacterized protein n=1 Tax=Helianthus annuus TaxID=4232 RepID=A0A9K3JWS9_HELAN|nr:hypothetical protein HanXRQr2_Chr01g0035091 [Helianthus annuus]
MYFWQSWGTNCVIKCKPQDHPCTFGKLGTRCKILVNLLGTIRVLHSCNYYNTKKSKLRFWPLWLYHFYYISPK